MEEDTLQPKVGPIVEGITVASQVESIDPSDDTNMTTSHCAVPLQGS